MFGGQQQTKTCALSPGEYTLICADSYGDGWNGAQLTIQGVTYCDDFTDGSEMMAQVTITDSWSPATETNGNAGIRLFHSLTLFHTGSMFTAPCFIVIF